MTAPYTGPGKKKKKTEAAPMLKETMREVPAKRTPRPAVDTVALKKEISSDSARAQSLGSAAALIPRRRDARPIETAANQADMSANLRRATLDSARTGKIPARNKIRAAIDTTALKSSISRDSSAAMNSSAYLSPRTSSAAISASERGAESARAAARGRATLDSARSGKIPATSGRSKIAAAMTKKKGGK